MGLVIKDRDKQVWSHGNKSVMVFEYTQILQASPKGKLSCCD